MTFKSQIGKLKENWLLVLIVIVVIGVFMFKGGSYGGEYSETSYKGGAYPSVGAQPSFAIAEMDFDEQAVRTSPSPISEGGVSDTQARLKAKTGDIRTEVDTGEFDAAAAQLKNIVKTSNALLLDETVNRYGGDDHPYHVANYRMKVVTENYDAVVAQLKEIGTLDYFNEDVEDVTERHSDMKVELLAEKERLKRYLAIYDEVEEIDDKISLSDKIFYQERTIKYYEDRIANLESRVEYSTIHVKISEEQETYFDIEFVGIIELVEGFLASISAILAFIFWAAPWAAFIGIVWWIYKRFKGSKKKRR